MGGFKQDPGVVGVSASLTRPGHGKPVRTAWPEYPGLSRACTLGQARACISVLMVGQGRACKKNIILPMFRPGR